jgi:hypothetical protein
MSTGNKALDRFFKREFEPDTGMWIRKHPELNKLEAMFFVHKNGYNPRYFRMGHIVIDRQEEKVVEL